jgi:murein lipoprotein
VNLSNKVKIGDNIMQKFVKLSALAMILAMGAGCQQITREEFEAVKSTADTALSEARAAKSAADAAASAAQATADEAKRAADEANACCKANSDKIDQLWNRIMRK